MKCELCQKNDVTDSIYDISLCEECYDGFMGVLQGDVDKLKKYSQKKNFPFATAAAEEQIIELAVMEYEKIGGTVLKEIEHQSFAKSFNEFYEYDVVTILNANHGQVDKTKMKQVLTDYARAGWKLHTMYSNELGKNAVALLGLGVNSTACEDVLIFERRIRGTEEL